MENNPVKKPERHRILQGRGGFLLLETLLSVVILAVGLTVVVRSFGSSIHALGTSGDYSRALVLLEERLWDLEAKGTIVPGVLTGKFTDEDQKFSWEVESLEVAEVGLCETRVTVSWERRGRLQDVSLVTYLKKE
jgi:hypothetical protein